MTVEILVVSLSQSEKKLLAMELIRQDLTNTAADLPSPSWHDAVDCQRLDSRLLGESLNLPDALHEI